MNRKIIAVIIIIFVASNALSFLFGANYNANPLVLNITNDSNHSEDNPAFNDYYENYTNITKKNITNSTPIRNSTNGTGNKTSK